MANYFARKAGNINATDVWATTPTGTAADVWSTFTTADVLHSNNFAITVNVSTTVGTVRNDTANSATAGGSFTLSNGVTLTADVVAGTVTCATFSGTAGNSATIVGNCTGGTSTSAAGASNASTGTLSITGNCTAGSGISTHGAINTSTGTINITGNCLGSNGISAAGANNSSTGTITITGNCTGGSVFVGANNSSTGTMTITGTINASEFTNGVGGGNRGQVTLLSGPFISSTTFGVTPIGCLSWRWASSLNTSAYIQVPTSNLLATRNLYPADNINGMPDEADVKDGVVYGPANELTGTFEQTVSPSTSDIATAVWSAATRTLTAGGGISAEDVWTYATREITGGTVDTLVNAPDVPTAEDIATEVWDTQTSGLTTSGAIGTRLKNSSTVATTGAQLAAALS